MKKMKNIYKISIMLLLVITACTDNLRDTSFAANMALPSDIAALYEITQDNTGAVTITPTANGAVSFNIHFGDATVEPTSINQGESIDHTYAEGTFEVKIEALNLGGDIVEIIQQLVVSFKAPQNLVAVIENDAAISKKVNITANADFAAMFDFDSGETGATQPVVSGNIGTTISYQYGTAGTYSVKVVAKGGAIETTEYAVEFEVTEILAPITSAPLSPRRVEDDVISIFNDSYTDLAGTSFYPNWGQSTLFTIFNLGEDEMLQYTNLDYQGIDLSEEVDASTMEFLHIDIWTPNATTIDIYPLPNGVAPADEKFVTKTLIPNEWNSFDMPMSDFTDQGLPINNLKQFKFVGSGTIFIDNFYFYKAPTPPSGAPIVFDDFEGNGNITTWAGDACGMDNTFANPFKGDLNNSNTVLEYNDTGGQYANIRFDKDSNFDLTGGNSIFKLKIYVPSSGVTGSQPNQISLKLQDADGNPWERQSEIVKTIALDTWQEVSFDFENDVVSGQVNPLSITNFSRVVLQVNSENNTDAVIAYFDDLSYGNAAVVDTAPFAKDDFEGNGTITTWAGDDCGMNNTLANPVSGDLNSSATVLEYNDTGGTYANIRFDVDPSFDLTAKAKFTLKIYVPSSSVSGSQPNQISLKLQDADGNPWERQSEVIKPIVLDTWQEVTFDFENDVVAGQENPLSITNFSRVVLQVNSEANSDTVIAYIDDFNYFK
jgi:hypothetical protein